MSFPHGDIEVGNHPLLICDLGWSDEEAVDTCFRLRSFAEDWNLPAMDAYDDVRSDLDDTGSRDP